MQVPESLPPSTPALSGSRLVIAKSGLNRGAISASWPDTFHLLLNSVENAQIVSPKLLSGDPPGFCGLDGP